MYKKGDPNVFILLFFKFIMRILIYIIFLHYLQEKGVTPVIGLPV